MTEKEKISRLETINQQIENLRQQTNVAKDQIKKHVEKRDQLNDEVRKAHLEIAELKTERDSLNEKVKLLKQERDYIRAKTTPIIDQINAVKEKIPELKKKVPRRSQRDLQEELDAVEWKIQTTSLDLQEEKRLIEDVKQLEIQLSIYKKIENQNKKIKELTVQRKALEAKADTFHKQLTDSANRSQELHSSMIEKVKTVKSKKIEADGLHQAYLKAKEEVLQLSVKIAELTGQLQGLRESLRASEREEAKLRKIATQQRLHQAIKEKEQKEQDVKEKLEAEARDKLKRGEKLSWNEFQLVMGESAQDDSETQD